jgi:hypothetical protein
MVHTIDFVEWNSHLKMPERKWDFTVDALGAYDTQAGEVVSCFSCAINCDKLGERNFFV